MRGGIAPLDVGQFLFLMDVDQHLPRHGLPQSGSLDLARLEDHVAVGEDHRRSPGVGARDHIQRLRIKTIGEWIVHEKGGHAEEARIVGMLQPVPLERAEVVGVAELRPQVLEDRPVTITIRLTEFPLQVAGQILRHPIVVQQRVVDVEQEDHPAL